MKNTFLIFFAVKPTKGSSNANDLSAAPAAMLKYHFNQNEISN
jgi:hypothetical protein